MMMWGLVLCAAMFGAAWGFKSAALGMMIPAGIVLIQRPTMWQLAKISIAGMAVFFLFAIWFNVTPEAGTLSQIVWQRLTTVQGDVPWDVWGRYSQGEIFPDYLPTLWAALGDRALDIFFGVTHADFTQWMHFHFDVIMTSLTGADVFEIEGGHSVTGTPFVEGLIAAGLPGVVFFGAIGGAACGLLDRIIVHSTTRLAQNPIKATLAATYAFVVVMWLNGGGIVQIFHIATLFGMALCWALLRVMSAVTFHHHTCTSSADQFRNPQQPEPGSYVSQ
jgi:hypothetical protein